MNFNIFFNDIFIYLNLYIINLLGFLLIITYIMVLFAKNAINSIFFLILAFIISSNLLIINNLEYLGIIFVLIYVGAIAILFVFVIMLLNIKTIIIKNNNKILDLFLIFFLISLFIYLFFLQNSNLLLISFDLNNIYTDFLYLKYINWSYKIINLNLFNILGEYLYNFYAFEIILASFLLLIPMIGAITINLKPNNKIKKQLSYLQINLQIKKKIKKKNFFFKNL